MKSGGKGRVSRVILVRHAMSEWNQIGRFAGRTDIPLSDLGLRQAERLALRLRAEAIGSAYASDLLRARRTAEIILAGHRVPLALAPDLREAAFGTWERLTYEEIAARFPEEWAMWTQDPIGVSPPGGGETMAQVRDRVVAFFQSVLQGGGEGSLETPSPPAGGEGGGGEGGGATVLLVSHGGPIRALVTHLLDVPLERYWRFAIGPASISIFDLYPEGAIAEVIGDESHLDGLWDERR